MEPLKKISSEKIIKEIQTSGSAPLLILGNDARLYYAKTTTTTVPRVELINEIVCGYLAQCWGLQVPPICLVDIPTSVVQNYVHENGKLSSRYDNVTFDDNPFFGSQQISAIELDRYFHGLQNISEYKLFNNPLDLIKIGVFDIWIGNKDRKPENPNILLDVDGKFTFRPIDHTAAFAHCTNYQQVNDIFVYLEDRFRLLNIPLVKSIAKFVTSQRLEKLKDEIESGIENSLKHLDFIFDQVPLTWGFSKKAKQHLKDFLSQPQRNLRMSEVFDPYLK